MTNVPDLVKEEEQGVSLAALISDYPEPVCRLIPFAVLSLPVSEWPDYPAIHGLKESHVPDLIRMMMDTRFEVAHEDWPKEGQPYGAPYHAMRALGQLKAMEALEPLLSLLGKEDKLLFVELPKVFVMLGPSVIPALIDWLNDPEQDSQARGCAADVLGQMAKDYPEFRADCVAPVLAHLDRYTDNDPIFNSLLLLPLIVLDVAEAAPTVQAAFEAGCMDESICGRWLEIKRELGLELTEEEQQELDAYETNLWQKIREMKHLIHVKQQHLQQIKHQRWQEASQTLNRQQAVQKAKAKRKQRKEARRKNR